MLEEPLPEFNNPDEPAYAAVVDNWGATVDNVAYHCPQAVCEV